MRSPRCGIVPPHLLEHLSHESERARRTLLTDHRHRAARSAFDSQPRSGDHATPDRTIYDAGHTETLPGTKARDEGDAPVDDESVNRAYKGLGATYSFFADVYGRDSLDDHGLPLIGTVHYSQDYDNAFWDGQQMVFGDGDGEIFRDFTIPLDVIAHELTHGVTEYTARLAYDGQAGALNESISDVFGSLVKQHHLRQTVDEADWLLGDGLFTDAVQGVALRSMKAPGTAYDDDVLGKDPQPATMADYVDTRDDNGGVHINSGIPNHAFYLLATELGGYAWEQAGRIWYQALTSGIPTDVTFTEFAAATRQAAADLYGRNATEHEAVEAAWAAVGVKAHSG
jgi:Zn-dependent metalloprotease